MNSSAVLYAGKHTVTFKNKGHKYAVDGILTTKGVTHIIQSVIAKNGLTVWPLNKAVEYLKGILETAQITEGDLEEAKTQHVKLRNAGANTGTTVHKLVASLLNDEKIDLLDYPEEVIICVEAFEKWLSEVTPDVIAIEQIVFSEELDYVGTFDSLLRINGKNYLCDLKTTNTSKDATRGVYPEHFIQLGAYAKAYLEQRSYELEVEGSSELVEIDDLMVISARKDGKVDTVKASEVGLTVDECIKLWECVHQLYTALEQLKDKLGASKRAT